MSGHFGTQDTAATGLVYVAGYGRSGSTLLDTLLGSHTEVFGGGELMWLFHEAADNGTCSCGEQVLDCAFWQEVLDRVASRLGHRDWRQAALLSEQTESLGRLRPPCPEYARQWTAAYAAIQDVSKARWVVDSSKNSRRVYHRLPLVGRHMSPRFRVLHLVRDPRAVMWSSWRGSNRRIEAGNRRQKLVGGMTRGLVSWMFSNAAVEYALRRHSHWPVLRVRYEDVVSAPQDTLTRLGRFLMLDMNEVIRRVVAGGSFASGHGICGNRMRRSGRIVLRFDREWESKLPAAARVSALLAWPLMRKYHYPSAAGEKADGS